MASLGTGMPRGGARAAATGGRGRGRGSGRRKRDTSRESDEYIPPSMRAAEKKRAREVAQFQAELSDSSDEEQDEQENIDAPRQEDDEEDNEDEVNNFIDQVFPLMDFAQVEAEDDPDAVDPDTQTQVDAAAGPHQLENVEAMYPPFFTEMAQLEPVEPRPDTVPEEQRGGLPEDDEQTVEEVNKEVEFMRPTEHGTNEEQMEGGLEPTRIVQEDVRTEEPPQVPELIGPTQGPVNFGEQFPDPPYNGPTFAEPSPPRIIPRVEFVSGMSKAPHFPQQPVARQNEDGSLELECYVDANPKPEIKWFYDNKEVKQDGRFSLKLDNRGSDQYSAILTIKDLADSDAGAYRCAIVNPHGKGNANFNLKLTGFSSPTFVEKPQISSRDDGQVMVMEFRAKSILKPVFVWSKGDEIVSPSDRIQVVLREEPNQIYYSALEIKDPTKEKDAGQFVCTAKNDSGKLTATFTVKFEVPQGAPTFTRKPQILQKTSDSGDPAIVFDIGYQADRNPEVIWINPKGKKMKESSRIKFGTSSDGGSNTFTATLELKNYKAKDSGTYTCNIKNDAGEANVELTLNIEGPMDDGAEGDSDA